MAVWAYKGIDARGKQVTGTRDADSPKSVRAALKATGVIVTEVSEARGRAAARPGGAKGAAPAASGLNREVNIGFFGRVKPIEVANFSRQVATLLKAGLPLAEGLGVISEQVDNKRFAVVLSDVRQRVNEGSSLADALGKHPRTFEDVFVSMVRAGETAGNLDVVLFRLADFMEATEKLKGKLSGAMVYPMIMTAVAGVIVGILMVKVVPSISQMFVDSGRTLPVHTRMLIWMSTFVQQWWWAIIAFWAAMFAVFTAWKKTPAGRERFDSFKLKAPVFGSLVRQVAVARFSRTLGTMLASGVPLLRALDVAKDILGNAVLRKVIDGAREQIQQGESIANTLRKSGQFPGMMCHMVAVGERSGQLETMLDNVATAYEGDADRRLTKLTAMLEPIIILLMGGMVAFVVFSIMSPIMDMTQFGAE